MKKVMVILIALFLVVTVNAQEQNITIAESPKYPIMSFPAAKDTVLINIEGEEFLVKQNGWLFVGLVKLHREWQRYNRECYNDSSLVWEQIFVPIDSLGDGVYDGYHTNIKRWVHKEAKWEDFMSRIGMIIDSHRIKKALR